MYDLETWFEKYIDRNFYLFPVNPISKNPSIYKNLTNASNDINRLNYWAAKFPECNWGLSLVKSGLVAIDIDEDGVPSWQALIAENGEPDTLKAQSGSGVGFHYIFKAKENVKYRGKIKKIAGIHVKHNGYICVAPSTHQSGKQYRWLNKKDPIDVPTWLVNLIEKQVEEKSNHNFAISEDLLYYADVIEKLKDKPLNYDEWIACGMGLYSTFAGNEKGLHLWLDLTEGINYKAGDLDLAKEKWDTFSIGDRTFGTVVHIAKEKGIELPNFTLAVDKVAFAQTALAKKNAEGKTPWFDDEFGRKLTVSKKETTNFFNSRGYCILGEGTIARIWTVDGVKNVTLIDPGRFDIATGHLFYKQYDRNGNFKLILASDLWRQSALKQTYSKIVFKPNAKDDELNLWSDIPCKPIMGNIDDIMYLIRDIICQGDMHRTNYLLDWCAHLVQKPQEKSTVVPVLIGEQGTGKGLFTDGILAGILSIFYIRLDKPGIITEKFNVEQSKKFLTVLDESSWRGHHELRNVLKSLTGNDTMTVEEKFGGRYSIENYSRYIVTSNSIEAVNVEVSNRRYLILEMSQKTENAFYKKLWNDVKHGTKCSHFYHFLMNRDISRFNPHEFPYRLDTQGMDTKLKSLNPVGQFWLNLLNFEPKRVFKTYQQNTKNVYYLDKKLLFDEYREFCKYNYLKNGISSMNFWLDTYALIPELKNVTTRRRSGKERIYTIDLNPNELRAAFCKRLNITVPTENPPIEDFIFDDNWVSVDDF